MENILNYRRDIISNTGDKKEACNNQESLISVIENKFQITKEGDLEIVDLIHKNLREADTSRAVELELEVEIIKVLIIFQKKAIQKTRTALYPPTSH